jgi:hypothetical protein
MSSPGGSRQCARHESRNQRGMNIRSQQSGWERHAAVAAAARNFLAP